MKKSNFLFKAVAVFGICFMVLITIIYIVDTPYRNARKLVDAIEVHDLKQTQELLDSGVDPNQATLSSSKFWVMLELSGRSPLATACAEGDWEMVDMLISHGATAEYDQATDWSPLRKTLFRFHTDDVEVVKMLLANGADPGLIESGLLPVFAAADMYPMPAGSENYTTDYNDEAAMGITEIVVLLLGNNSVNIQSNSGDTLLMYAAKRGNIYLAEYLLANGCDSGLMNKQGKTAYDYAVENDKQALIDLLEYR